MTHQAPAKKSPSQETTLQYVTLFVKDQIFGVPILDVQDILKSQHVTRVPLAPAEVAGSLNLRGRIITAIDMRKRLNLPADDSGRTPMNVVVEVHGELFSLMVDRVGDVMDIQPQRIEKNPSTLDPAWFDLSSGVCQLEDSLLILLNVQNLIKFK